MTEYYDYPNDFPLELGGSLSKLRIAYNTYGTLNERRDNVVWVCHGLTANSDVQDWWPHTVEEGRFLDPRDHFIVCANFLGSPYGTSGPMQVDPATGKLYLDQFPKFTIRDMVRAHMLLAEHLGISRIDTMIGVSVGGFQALEWAVMKPESIDKMILMATDAIASPWTIALDETMRMAIEEDPTFGDPTPDAGKAGLATARAIALLSYRGPSGYNFTQRDVEELPAVHRASSYQRYHGEKLCRRYDVYSYYSMLNSFDTQDLGRGRGGVDAALATITAKTLVVGITTDIVVPPYEVKELASKIPGASYAEIESRFGHDGFLVEHQQLHEVFNPFING